MAKALKFAKEHGVVTTFDQVAFPCPNLKEIVTVCMPYTDYFMPGFEEAIMMCGMEDRREVIKFFLDAGAKHTVFKMGGEGSSIAYMEDGQLHESRVPALKAPIVDSTGCGDAYCAGFIMGLSMGLSNRLKKIEDQLFYEADFIDMSFGDTGYTIKDIKNDLYDVKQKVDLLIEYFNLEIHTPVNHTTIRKKKGKK